LGKKFRCPSIKIGQYVQGHTGGSNSTDQERSINAFYIIIIDNGSGHVVFKPNTKQPVSVKRVDTIPTTEAVINTVNDIREQEEQPEGIEFSDIADNDNNEDSNASDDEFELYKEYKEEVDNEIALEEEAGDVGNKDPDSQEDYFQNPIQQHEWNVQDNNEAKSAIIPKSKRGANPIIALSKSQFLRKRRSEYGKRKKNNTDDDNASVGESLEDDNMSGPNSIKVGVSDMDDVNEDTDDCEDDKEVPKELNSDLGPYWTLAQSTCSYVLNTITSYSNIEASKIDSTIWLQLGPEGVWHARI
jgi:hypothetical protein